MRAWTTTMVAMVLAASLLAGCTIADEEPQESTEAPEESVAATPPPPAEPTPATEPTAEPTPVDPSLQSPAPPGEGVVFPPDPQPVEPAPEAPAPAEPAPTAPAPAEPAPEEPAADPEPDPAPAPRAPAPEPDDGDDESWPREGSYVRYRVTVFESIPGSAGNDGYDTYTNLSWTYRDGDWHGTCEGQRYETFDGTTDVDQLDQRYEASDPPHWPLFNTREVPDVGDDVEAWFVKGCDIQSVDRRFAGEDGDMYVATDYDDGSPDDFRTEWSQETGLVASWEWSQRNTSTRGVLTGTDAPGL